MSINPNSTALHLNLPSSGPSSASRTPSLVTVHPSVLAQILDHQSRKTASQPRVIGTLLGVRSAEASTSTGPSSEIEIRNCFAIPHEESEDRVAVDMDYHKSMMELMNKVGNGREVIVGWYSSTPDITPYSALIQNFFATETATTGPAIHLTFNSNINAENPSGLSVKAYVSQQVGTNPRPENCVFLPVACAVKYQLTEKAGLDILTSNNAVTTTTSPLQSLSQSIDALSQNITTIQEYVEQVKSGARPADPEVGRYLLEAVGRWKSVEASTSEDDGEEGVKKGLQDVLSVSYLSALVRTQVELSSRLNLLT